MPEELQFDEGQMAGEVSSIYDPVNRYVDCIVCLRITGEGVF